MDRWQQLFDLRDEQRRQVDESRVIVRYDDLSWESNRQGKMKWYLHPLIKDTAHRALMVYVQEIPPGSHSGKLQHQGGAHFFVWKGRGYSVINGERHDWEEWDLILMPVSTQHGVTYQHFNLDPKEPAVLIAMSPNHVDALGVDMGASFEQLEDAPK